MGSSQLIDDDENSNEEEQPPLMEGEWARNARDTRQKEEVVEWQESAHPLNYIWHKKLWCTSLTSISSAEWKEATKNKQIK